MSVPPSFARLLFAFTVMLCVPGVTTGDSWIRPKTFTVKSANGKYVAVVVPGGVGGKRASVRLYEGEPGPKGQGRVLWEADLGNGVAPVNVIVSDDGRHVVTMDDWGHAGYGENAIAFYDSGRRTGNFAPERFLTGPELQQIKQSTSSRWWREDAIELLRDIAGRRLMCVWLPTSRRWLAWDVSTGRAVDIAGEVNLSATCNAAARTLALERLRDPAADWPSSPNTKVGSIRFLEALRDPRDRAAIERLLAATDFESSTSYTSFGPNRNDALVAVGARSHTRKAADSALAAWDGRTGAWRKPGFVDAAVEKELKELREDMAQALKETKDPQERKEIRELLVEQEAEIRAQHDQQRRREEEEGYFYLGTAQVLVRLGDVPPPEGGALWVYLVPETVPPDKWAQQPPVQRVRFDFEGRPPWVKEWPRELPVSIEGVTPGRYWVKAVYDRAAPFCDPAHENEAAVCRPGPGDAESAERRVIEVKPGGVIKYGELACTRRVG